MSTRSALFFANLDNKYTRIYCHFDGYPDHMLPALSQHDPAAILAAKEIRQITADKVEGYPDAREPEIVSTTELPEWAAYGYFWDGEEWVEV